MAKRRSQSRPKKRLPQHLAGDRFTGSEWRAYTAAIGQLSLAWNDLHEKLGLIFVALIEAITEPDPEFFDPEGYYNPDDFLLHDPEENLKHVMASVWSSCVIDRLKREMLKAAVTEIDERELLDFPKLKDDIEWTLKKADRLEDARNDAIHSPLLFLGGPGSAFHGLVPSVIPNPMLNNKRATKLIRGTKDLMENHKALLDEFRWCRNASLELREFLIGIHFALKIDERAWPDRPQLPSRRGKS